MAERKSRMSSPNTLLRKINKELGSIPDYDTEPLDFPSGQSVSQFLGNANTALRRAVRSLRGGESKPALELKRRRVMDLIAETAELKETGFNLGTGPMEGGKKTYTNRSESQVRAAGNQRRRDMKKE